MTHRRPAVLALAILAAVLTAAPAALAHDLFLVVPDHDVPAGGEVAVALYNGTFASSENTIDRDRMTDVTVVDGAGEASHPAADQWRDEGTVTLLDLATGTPGTYLVGVSTAPRMIELTAEEFNEYLEHDGVLDVLAARKEAGIAHRPARERYAKHVKTLLDVGDEASDTFRQRLGYPAEIVPLENPARLEAGAVLPVLVLAGGEPLADQLVYAGYAAEGSGEEASRHGEAQARTDAEGVARIELSHPGRWYVRLIHMVAVDEEGVDYESNWATLTFDVE